MRSFLIAMVFFAGVAMINCQLASGVYAIRSANDQGTWDFCGADDCYPDETDLFSYDVYHPNVNTQKFTVTALDNGFYTFGLPSFGLAVEYRESDVPTEAIFISQRYDPTNVNQQFSLVARKDGTYIVKPRNFPNLAIRSPLAGNFQEMALDTKSCVDLDQRYHFIPSSAQAAYRTAATSARGVIPRPN